MRRRDLLAAATLGVTGTAGCVQVSREETVREESYRPPEGALALVSRADDVTVRSTDSDAVEVTVRNRYGPWGSPDVQLETARTGGDLTVTVPEHGGGNSGLWGSEVDLEAGVPAGVSLESVTATDGDVSVSGIGGAVDVGTDDGDVSVSSIGGAVDAGTDDGDVAARDVGGDVTAETSDGDVTVSDAGGDVVATTDDGDVTVSDVDGYVTAETADGDVVVADAGGIDGATSDDGDVVVDVASVRDDVRVSTRDGDVAARLAADLDATVAVVTDDGDLTISTDAFDAVEENSGTYVRGRLGEGTHVVRIQTKAGDVTVDRL